MVLTHAYFFFPQFRVGVAAPTAVSAGFNGALSIGPSPFFSQFRVVTVSTAVAAGFKGVLSIGPYAFFDQFQIPSTVVTTSAGLFKMGNIWFVSHFTDKVI